MSEGGNNVYKLKTPYTLLVEEPSTEDVRPITPTPSITSSTTVRWIPGGLFGRLLQVFGPGAVDLVTRFNIKKRLSSISSAIDTHILQNESFSEGETERFGAAYRILVQLSSGSYKATFRSQALRLRLTILRAIISSERSCFSSHWQKYTLGKTWAELDKLAMYPHESNVRNTASELKSMLVAKVTDELSSLGTHLHANDLGTLLSGTNIVIILCRDLAYGTGGYPVQSALDRISCSSWGAFQLRTLNIQGDLVLHALRRLLVDFDNVFSKAMAFRIFGEVAAEDKTGKLGPLLAGPFGIGSLVERFNFLIQPTVHSYHRRFGVQCTRSMEALCTAISSACCHGFMPQVVEQGLCLGLITLVEIFVERDDKVLKYIDYDEKEDPDVERDQIAVCKLMLKLLQNDEARDIMLEYGALQVIRQFGSSSHREMSESFVMLEFGLLEASLHNDIHTQKCI